MNITNGTVSRTFKPAEYEGRTVTLSFMIDPDEDAEACVARVVDMAERRARVVPNVGDKQPEEAPKPVRRPPAVAENPTVPAAEEVSGSASEVVVVTDDALMKACQRTTHRLRDPAPTKAVVREFVEKAGMSVITIPQEKRAAFIEALEALKQGGE